MCASGEEKKLRTYNAFCEPCMLASLFNFKHMYVCMPRHPLTLSILLFLRDKTRAGGYYNSHAKIGIIIECDPINNRQSVV